MTNGKVCCTYVVEAQVS